jgi:phosphate transport system protein
MEPADLSHHILSRFNSDLEGVRSAVLQMGGLVERQLQDGVRAVVNGDSRLGEEVAKLDHKVNAMEIAIDDDCSRILATRAPAASDLRLLVAVIKTITDLERIGDEAEKLGHIGARLASIERPTDRYREVKHIGELVADMVNGALDAFARLDSEAALRVARRDKQVDEEYDAIQRQCITFMLEDPRTIRRTLDVLWVARALERVGDHAKNICEYVIYMVLGKDVRHRSLDDVAKQIVSARAAREVAAR